jgi:TetR/AcrR family transcriptional regulator, lmrAB and yxaGH operons repressor
MDESDSSSSGRTRSPRGAVRTRMVAGAVHLLATKGVEGTSFAEVLEATDSPRGSVYHHFPGGKPELLHAALDLASERGLAAMEATRGQASAVVIERFLSLWRALLEYSQLTAGCALVAVTIAGSDDDLVAHAGTIFRTWTELLTDLCVAGGTDKHSARPLAVAVIAATEGAVALCRAERNMEPFEDVETVLLALVSSFGVGPSNDTESESDDQDANAPT